MEFDRKKLPTILMILTIGVVIVIFNVFYFANYISANNEKISDSDLTDDDINPVRDAAVAGLFYPADVYQLDQDVDGYLEHVASDNSGMPQIIIVPHAGYQYSAQVASYAYKRLEPYKDKIKNVFLLGPSHNIHVDGVALSTAKSFRTPLGNVKTNSKQTNELLSYKLFKFNDTAHRKEHSLEVQLPFLQKTLSDFKIIPMLYGRANPVQIANALIPYIQRSDSILVISADLSHYQDYKSANKTDSETAQMIADEIEIDHHRSCGATAINTAMIAAKEMGFVPKLLNMVNSGDVSSDKDRVVGYGAWIYETPDIKPELQGIELEQANLQNFARHNKNELLSIVKQSLEKAVKNNEQYVPQREDFNNFLFNKGASFVTLTKQDKLRGCIGSLMPEKAIAVDIANNTYQAALKDNRFQPVTEKELPQINYSISFLTSFEEIKFNSYAELLSKIEPKVDGILIKDGKRQGVFLPSVWQTIPDKEEFFSELKIKAGLSPSYWSNNLRAFRFRTVEIKNDNN